jgi:hypothetical protein
MAAGQCLQIARLCMHSGLAQGALDWRRCAEVRIIMMMFNRYYLSVLSMTSPIL